MSFAVFAGRDFGEGYATPPWRSRGLGHLGSTRPRDGD